MLASQAGIAALRSGGSTVDAAIAANVVLAVAYPHLAGLGGDAFWLIYAARDKQVRALIGAGEPRPPRPPPGSGVGDCSRSRLAVCSR
jgi:gamma-glutamyltranspeptidase